VYGIGGPRRQLDARLALAARSGGQCGRLNLLGQVLAEFDDTCSLHWQTAAGQEAPE
jgi:hypothetical protein